MTDKIVCHNCGSSYDRLPDNCPVVELRSGNIKVLDYRCPACLASLRGYEKIERSKK
jgi:hypothetical protein